MCLTVKKKKIGRSAAKLHNCSYEESSTTISVRESTLSNNCYFFGNG